MSERFEQFEHDWLQTLRKGARVAFEHGQLGIAKGTHCDVADGFITMLGLKPIGFNWELLDATNELGAARSALGQLTQALSHDITNPSRPWLTQTVAAHCARQFFALFSSSTLTVVANRYDGLWNPISGAANEWAFVAYDNTNIALLLIADS